MSNPTELPVMAPCPHCGDTSIAMHPNDLAEDGRHMSIPHSDVNYAHCDGCGAEGPQAFTHSEARDLWNRRAQPEGEASDIDEEAERTSATDRVFPITDSPHASVQQRTAENRAAFGFGWDARAELSKLDWQQGYADALDLHELGPKAPEGEAPQTGRVTIVAECEMFGSEEVEQDARDRIDAQHAATLSPLCGAQHAESGTDYIMAAVASYAGDRSASTLERIRRMVGEGEQARAALAAQSQGAQAVARVQRQAGASEFDLVWLQPPGPDGTLLYAAAQQAAAPQGDSNG